MVAAAKISVGQSIGTGYPLVTAARAAATVIGQTAKQQSKIAQQIHAVALRYLPQMEQCLSLEVAANAQRSKTIKAT